MENGAIAPLLGEGDFVQGLPSSPSGEISMAAGAWERSEDIGYRVGLARAGDTPSSHVKSDRRPGNGDGLVDLGHPVVSESGGFTPRCGGDAMPSSIGAEARSTSRRGGFAAGVSSGRKPLVIPGSYDGSRSLMEYLSHFTLVTKVNRWTSQEAALYLAVSLSGPPRCLLSGVDLVAAAGASHSRAGTALSATRPGGHLPRTVQSQVAAEGGEYQPAEWLCRAVGEAGLSIGSFRDTWWAQPGLFHGRTGQQQPSPVDASVQANLLPSGSRRCAARWGLFPGGRRAWDPPPAYYGWPGECSGTIIGACSRAAIGCCIRS